MSGSERRRELRRRRHRTKKVPKLLAKAAKGDGAVKAKVAEKLRKITPGATVLIERYGLE